MDLITTQSVSVNSRVKSVSLNLHEGEVLGLIGPNGAGKTTLLHGLAGIEQTKGEILIEGLPFHTISPTQRARQIGLQPQIANSAWSLTVADVVSLGRLPWGDNNESIVQQAMERAGVAQFAQRRIDQLSGGERARVWLARVLAGEPRILLVDEPIANLDIHYQISVMDVLRMYAEEGHGIIVAMHDLSLAARYCDRLCLMNNGEVTALGTCHEVLNEDLLSKTYGVSVDIDLNREPPIVLPR